MQDNTSAHHSSAQFASVVLTPRSDLSINLRDAGGQPVYVIEDPRVGSFYRIGQAEYTFLSLLDGRRTVADVLGLAATRLREQAFAEHEAAAFCRWMVEAGLASTDASMLSHRIIEDRELAAGREASGKLNPMFQKVPIGNPDGLMKRLAAVCGWLFSGPAFVVWGGLISAALIVFWLESSQSGASFWSQNIIAENNWLWLLATTIVLKVLHECAHGCACRWYRAPVREWGLMFILFVPLPYMDVTASWRIASQWRRIMISFAGMFVELAIAAVAVFVWAWTSDPLLRQHAFNVILSAGAMTVLFNANPLMRFDGYYMLTDILSMPNLAAHGQTLVKQRAKQFFYGLPASIPTWPEGRTWLVALYGVAAFIWRITVCVGMVLAADALYFGLGAILAAIAVALWVIAPAFRIAKFAIAGSETEKPRRLRFAAVCGGLALLVGCIGWLPWTGRVEAPTVYDFDPLIRVRSKVDGFVRTVHVDAGQQVQAGDPIAELQNPELQAEHKALLANIAAAEQKSRLLFAAEDLTEWESTEAELVAMCSQLEDIEMQLNELQIFAPTDGVILTADVDRLAGRFVRRGSELVQIGDANQRRLVAMVAQEDVAAFRNQLDSKVDVHVWGEGQTLRTATLLELDPRATDHPPHPALTATHGGELPVRLPTADEQQADEGGVPQPRLLDPHVVARLQLETGNGDAMNTSEPLIGQRAVVSFRAHQGRIAEVVKREFVAWYLNRQAALMKQWRM